MELPKVLDGGLPEISDNTENPNTVASLAIRAESVKHKHTARITAIETSIQKTHDDLFAELSDSMLGHNKGVVMDEKLRAKLLENVKVAALQKSAEARAAAIALYEKELNDAEAAAADSVERLTALLDATGNSPAGLLNYITLNDLTLAEHKGKYGAALANAPHQALINSARQAVASNNVALGSAVLDRIEQLPKEARPSNSVKVAIALVGKMFNAVSLAAETARLNLADMKSARFALKTGKVWNSVDKIKRGLDRLAANRKADEI